MEACSALGTTLLETLNVRVNSNIELRYCISLMDVAQNLISVTSYYIYFKLLMILSSI